MIKQRQLGSVLGKVIAWVVLLGVVVTATLFVWTWFGARKIKAERTSWKDTTLIRLGKLSIPSPETDQKLESLRDLLRPGERQSWMNPEYVWTTNGEYLVYAFYHGINVGWVDHLFLARGSDGRWYYSTYHFCNGMVGILGDEQPKSISEFVKRYSLQEFDGKSDVCLQHTWP